MRKTLTDKGVAALKPRASRYAFPDPELRGHYVRVQPTGAKAFVTVARDPVRKKQIWNVIGAADVLSIDDARKQARKAIERVRAGQPAFEAPPQEPDSFEKVANNWLERHAKAKGLRSLHEIERLLRAHVFPVWANRPFLSIRRSDVAALLDEVEDNHSPRQADAVLTVVRSMMNWFATRHDDYIPPITRGMRRQSPKAQARARILTDDEIRAIWKPAATDGPFGALVRLALLTAQRRAKVLTMKWDDLADGEWTIPKEPREKDNAGTLVLPELALKIIDAQPRLGKNPYVIAGRGNGRFNGLSKAKRRLDARLSGVAPWQVHDLRRTARSLLSRAGVRPDIAERVMGHAIAGVEGVYDRHSYRDEKADALRRLASLIETIINPRSENVVPMSKPRRRRT
jgi:integrase